MRPHHTREVIVSAERIARRVDELVVEMADLCRGENFVMIGILRGSFIFLADLVRALHHHQVHPRIDFMTLESYGAGTESTGHIRVVKDIRIDLAGADVLVVDDILDTGRTLHRLRAELERRHAREVRTCVFLDKPSRRQVPLTADFRAFEVENLFVVGYGLDFAGRYRNLPYVGALKREIYAAQPARRA
jgi:hypoxanthine phosphoribosyltransferase